MLFSDRAWISSGQWGSDAIGAFALSYPGFLVLTRARRAETTIAFLLACGALLIFAFFMISDSKTTLSRHRKSFSSATVIVP
jgi:integral membrane sensor domain MASE1